MTWGARLADAPGRHLYWCSGPLHRRDSRDALEIFTVPPSRGRERENSRPRSALAARQAAVLILTLPKRGSIEFRLMRPTRPARQGELGYGYGRSDEGEGRHFGPPVVVIEDPPDRFPTLTG